MILLIATTCFTLLRFKRIDLIRYLLFPIMITGALRIGGKYSIAHTLRVNSKKRRSATLTTSNSITTLNASIHNKGCIHESNQLPTQTNEVEDGTRAVKHDINSGTQKKFTKCDVNARIPRNMTYFLRRKNSEIRKNPK